MKPSNEQILRDALQKIIDMNVQYCIDKYGNAKQAETMGCVTTARAALAATAPESAPDDEIAIAEMEGEIEALGIENTNLRAELKKWETIASKGGSIAKYDTQGNLTNFTSLPAFVASPATSPSQSADQVRDAKDAARWRYVRDTETLETAVWEALEGTDCAPGGVFNKAAYASGMDRAVDAAILATSSAAKGERE